MAADGSVCAHGAEVVEVDVDGKKVGHVFGVDGAFWFVLDDERDRARGPFDYLEAIELCRSQAKCIEIADLWEIMLDT